MKTITIFLLMLTVFGECVAQDLKIAPVIGPNVTFGLLSKAAKDHYYEQYYEDFDITLKHKFPPGLRFQIGALADYSINNSLSVQSGLLFNFRGFHTKLKADFLDEDGVQQSIRAKDKMSITYLEIPIWLSYKLGETGFKLMMGPTIGFAIGGTERAKATYGGQTETDSQKISIGNDPDIDVVKPLDLSLNLGLTREILLGDKPLDVTLFAQPSISKWNVAAPQNSEYFIRHFTAGIRVAYFFSLN